MSTLYDDMIYGGRDMASSNNDMMKQMANIEKQLRMHGIDVDKIKNQPKSRPTPPPAPPARRPTRTEDELTLAKKQIKLLEKILDDIWDVHEAENKNSQTVINYSKTGKYAIEAYRLYMVEKAKNELMK